jgi:hypothetical protein
MVLDTADIDDSHVWRGCETLDGAAEPVLDLPVAATRPRSKAFGENFCWRRDRNHRDIGIGAAYRANHRARNIRHHCAPGADVVIDSAGQSVAMAVGLPMHREIAAHARLPERLGADLLIIFEGGRFPRHYAARKDNVVVGGAGGPRQPD